MLNIQYVSDLHIEGWPTGSSFYQFVTPVAPILVIAGDICSAWNPLYKHFLDWTSRNWHIVILVAGNHEYHCIEEQTHTLKETDNHIQSLCKTNIHFLQSGESYTIPNTTVRFVGATLWSDIDPELYEQLQKNKKDFTHCWTTPFKNLTPADTSHLHRLQTHALHLALKETKPETLIVVTHYMPSLDLLESEYKDDSLRTCYASQDDWLLTPNIKAWICGHSHRATIWRSPLGVPVYMNARGYNKEKELKRLTERYNPSAKMMV